MTQPSFKNLEAAIALAAAEGAAASGAALAQTLQALGEAAAVSRAPDGSVEIVVEGAGALAREFGTLRSPAQPFLAPALQANRATVMSIVGQKIGEVLRGRS